MSDVTWQELHQVLLQVLGKAKADELFAAALTDTYGTKRSGYAGPEAGPFRCDHCKHVSEQDGVYYCDHPEVLADEEVEQQDGKAVIDAAGCCTYYWPQPASQEDTGEEAV